MTRIEQFFQETFVDLGRQFRWSFVPPLMVYFAAGFAGLTAIVGTFFVKEYLGLSAAFLAGLAFWAGLPWTLKMPIGHLVDIMWRWKFLLVYLGAALITASLVIMYALLSYPGEMTAFMPAEAWYVLSVLLAPSGYVIQDAVADAMSVDAVPKLDDDGRPIEDAQLKILHTTMQTLGRIALIMGLVSVAVLNIFMFSGIENLNDQQKADVYAQIYLAALFIPLLSISGVALASLQTYKMRQKLRATGLKDAQVEAALWPGSEGVEPNYWYFGGGIAFVIFTMTVGLSDPPYAQEIVFTGSMAIVLVMMAQLARELSSHDARVLFGTAMIIFVFRATPLPGPGATWFEIDVLGFDQQFLSVLTLITSLLTLAGMIVLRPFMATRSISYIIVVLAVAAGLLSLPNIGLYYGLHEWTAERTAGVVDARFIAILDTAIESPLGQIAMIPMLAWIAKSAPDKLKATFFAVMASFTNLALSASSLFTKYLNEIFLVTREVRDRATDAITVTADYSQLGWVLITAAAITIAAPLTTVWLIQKSRWRSDA
jgi:BT1 family